MSFIENYLSMETERGKNPTKQLLFDETLDMFERIPKRLGQKRWKYFPLRPQKKEINK